MVNLDALYSNIKICISCPPFPHTSTQWLAKPNEFIFVVPDLLLSSFRVEHAGLRTQGSSVFDFRLWPLLGATLSLLFDHHHSDGPACLTASESKVVAEILHQLPH